MRHETHHAYLGPAPKCERRMQQMHGTNAKQSERGMRFSIDGDVEGMQKNAMSPMYRVLTWLAPE